MNIPASSVDTSCATGYGGVVAWTYVLICGDESLYTGYTPRLMQRLEAHAKGTGARYTRGRGPLKLAIAWGFGSRSEAMRAEVRVKRLSRIKKLRLIESPESLDQFGFDTRVIQRGDPDSPALTGKCPLRGNPDTQALV